MNLQSRIRDSNELPVSNFTFGVKGLQNQTWKILNTSELSITNLQPPGSHGGEKFQNHPETEESTAVSARIVKPGFTSSFKLRSEFLDKLQGRYSSLKSQKVKVKFEIPVPRSDLVEPQQCETAFGEPKAVSLMRSRIENVSTQACADITPSFRRLNTQSGMVPKLTFGRRNTMQNSSSTGSSSWSTKSILVTSEFPVSSSHRRTFTAGCPLDLSSKRHSFSKLPAHPGDEAAASCNDTVGPTNSGIHSQISLEKVAVDKRWSKISRIARPEALISMSINRNNLQSLSLEQKKKGQNPSEAPVDKIFQRKRSVNFVGPSAGEAQKIKYIDLWQPKATDATQVVNKKRQDCRLDFKWK